MSTTKDTNNKLTIFLDASALKNSACRRKLFYDTVLGYKEHLPGNDTVFGTAFHKFRALWRETGDETMAIKEALKCYEETPKHLKDNKSFLTRAFLHDVCSQYYELYIKDDFEVFREPKNNVALIEPVTRFAIPYHSCDEFDIIIAGTMDELGKFRLTQHFGICDVKTSGAWRLKDFMHAYKMSPQLLMYRWCVWQYAKHYPGSIWDEINKTPVACFIDGVFYKAGTKAEGPSVEFLRKDMWKGVSYIYFKQEQIEEFDRMLAEKVKEFIEMVERYIKHKTTPDREGIMADVCVWKFGACKYFDACSAPDQEASDAYLENTFKKSLYNPLTFGEQH